MADIRSVRARWFNSSAYAGPRRFVVLGGAVVLVAAALAVVSFSGHSPPPVSNPGHLAKADALPGGVNSDPQQEKLARQADQEAAAQAAAQGRSYTPPLPGAVRVSQIPYSVPTVPATTPPAVTFEQPVAPVARVEPKVHYVNDPYSAAVAATPAENPNQAKLYDDAVNRVLHGAGTRPPQTDVMIEPDSKGAGGDESASLSKASPAKDASYVTRSSAGSDAGKVLMPAGRGVFAHTILAADSDSPGPVILQADSGPLAGDRMIGSFSKAGGLGSGTDRLVVRVESIEHQGRTIGVDGLVTAPDTMETTVASSVDEHYASRFLLPAAAAFVEGLGVALATTSNTITTNSAFGGSTAATSLSLPQQLGVAAGTAAQNIGSTLAAQAPKGPTVHLDANSNVGVMFLTAVTAPSSN